MCWLKRGISPFFLYIRGKAVWLFPEFLKFQNVTNEKILPDQESTIPPKGEERCVVPIVRLKKPG